MGFNRHRRSPALLHASFIFNKPPYVAGTLQLPKPCFSLFYKVAESEHSARHIDFASATPEGLGYLTQACERATFGINKEDVMDESYRKAGKIDAEHFSTPLVPDHTDLVDIVRGYLLEGAESTRAIKFELYKLNVYDKGSFFKPHVDTPRSERMFGSLVLVFPTPHEGGALFLRRHGQEWVFDSGTELARAPPSSLGYVAFFSDIEHEVAPVTSGHRVTLTYNLYFDDDAASNTAASPPKPVNEHDFRVAFETLLTDPNFLPDGGTLGFGLQHAYQIEDDLKHVYGLLKGTDAVIHRVARALGETVVKLDDDAEVENLVGVIRYFGGVVVRHEKGSHRRGGVQGTERVNWVTPVTTFSRQTVSYLAYGNQASMGMAYGDVCLIVRIGKVGGRQAYAKVAQMKAEWQELYDKGQLYTGFHF
ncbi:hypothetical protein BC834DRAFT_387863 [Gloeopeniophorella convolvens]|nr:hypothetical protein BC834DRAFT_387863 [Gloeopeniophorella convolvens]